MIGDLTEREKTNEVRGGGKERKRERDKEREETI